MHSLLEGVTCSSIIAYVRTALFWVVMQPVVIISYRSFETTHRSHLQRSRILLASWPLKMGSIVCSEMSVRDYHYLQRHNPKESSSHIIRAGSHRVATQLQLINISYHIISYHIISYHIISYIISYRIISHRIIYRISYIISYHLYHIMSYRIIYMSYHIVISACKQFIPFLYLLPSSWRRTQSFETWRRHRKIKMLV